MDKCIYVMEIKLRVPVALYIIYPAANFGYVGSLIK